MRGVNKVILVGNIGQDPEVKTLQSGGAVVNCSLATTSTWKDSSGQRNERVEWHRLVMFNRLAEIAGQFLRKGSPIYVEGTLETQKWEKEGVQMQTTKIVVREMQMLGRKDDSYGDTTSKPSHNDQNSYNRKPAEQSTNQNPSPSEPQVPFDDFDDDIPF